MTEEAVSESSWLLASRGPTATTLEATLRPQILALLRQREWSVPELAAILGLSQQQTYRQLRALLKTGLVVPGRRPKGKGRTSYRLEPKAARALDDSSADRSGRSASQEDQALFLALNPPPGACQVCGHSRYVYTLLENIQHQLEESYRYREQLRQLSSQILGAQEEERKRVARELHDDTAQALTSLLVRLRLLERATNLEEAKASLGELRDLTASTLQGVRQLALDLRPSVLDDLGLVAALKWHIGNFGQRWGIRAEFQARGLNGRLSPDLELVLYRVAQEALTNVAKHSGASRVSLSLELHGRRLRLTVEDDGRGFPVAQFIGRRAQRSKGQGLGLFGMQERLALVAGKLSIESQPGSGTKLVAEVPLRAPAPLEG